MPNQPKAKKPNMTHIDESESAFALMASMMRLASEDYAALLSLGLVDGKTVRRGNWPKAKNGRFKVVYVQPEELTVKDAEHLVWFLFKGGAKKFFWTFGLEPDVDGIVDRLIEEKKEQKQ